MNLFDRNALAADRDRVAQLKRWLTEALALAPATTISISQLRCSEPGCPPIETAIAVMGVPPVTYKIHKAVADIERADVEQLASQTADLRAPESTSANESAT